MSEPKPVGASADPAKEKVRRYYEAATSDYLRYYETDWHHHMHYGFDRDLPKGGNPTEQLVRYAAHIGSVQAGERALDVGCGVGGTALWLAEHCGTRSVGLNLMEFQLRLARGYATRKNPPLSVAFAAGDFMHPPFAAASFDVIIAIESFDHAPDKRAFVRAMSSLLRPNGRLILVDGFRAARAFTAAENRDYARFLAGWAVPHLCNMEEVRAWAAEAGLAETHGEDITADVLPHARAIYRFAFVFVPLRRLLLALRLTRREKLGNAAATYHQYRTLKSGLWHYAVFCFRKP